LEVRLLAQWKVTYTIADAVEVDSQVKQYPAFGIELHYNGQRLMRVEHTVEAEDTASHDDLIVLSDRKLRLFRELLEYRRLLPIRISTRTTEKVVQAENEPTIRTGEASIGGAYCVARPINMPTEAMLSNAQPRLSAWLRLANEARHTESDTEAIHNYYAIWEDMQGRPPSGPPPWPPEVELKYTRDFVSHGEPLKNPQLKKFLKCKLGHPVNQFDPHEASHQALVRQQRRAARNLIEAELEIRSPRER
jgi:hypothetical protein